MVQFHSEKFNIAWFKLAEFVTRKEKERAFGIYRLLVHSLPDEAFAAQLEADMLLAFQDEKALKSYLKSAQLYAKQHRWLIAALIYEKLISLEPNVLEHKICLLHMHTAAKDVAQVTRCATHLARAFIKHSAHEQADEFIEQLALPEYYRTIVQESFLWQLLAQEQFNQQAYLQKIIAKILLNTSSMQLSSFLLKLEALDASAYAFACASI